MAELDKISARSYQIMIRVLKDRCATLEHRVTLLEDENKNLKINNYQQPVNILSENQQLKEIVKLTEDLSNTEAKYQMVYDENKKLKSLLKKLSKGNSNLNSKLDNITSTSDKLHSPLIRSKTFTQQGPQTNKNLPTVDDDKIAMEYEDISLKLHNSIMKLESECENIDFPNSLLLDCPNELMDEMFGGDNIEEHILMLESIKVQAIKQNQDLKILSNEMDKVGKQLFEKCEELNEKCINLASKQQQDENVNENGYAVDRAIIYSICPMCNEAFNPTDCDLFYQHVENHFTKK